MAKKVKKAVAKKKVATKKVSKPVKKAANKKAAKPAKKAAPKKAAKKVAVKKIAKKKVAPKKATKKVVVKKKVAPKKVVKKVVKKVAAKKIVTPKKVTKKVAVKKVAKKTLKTKPVQKVVSKPIAKQKVAAVEKKMVKPSVPKASKAKIYPEDSVNSESMIVEYKTPTIHRPLGPTPKPYENKDTRTRYSNDELKEFKELILKKLAEAQTDFELLKNTLSHKDDHGTDDTSPTFKLLEDGSDVLSKEETAHLASRQEKFIQNLQNALIRIANKTYGICRVTGKLIAKERLKAVPHATLAIGAKLDQR